MAADFPDLHHKLCKKLAHLITGFYHLNTKSDETDLIVRNTVETYEDEMDKIIISANVIIEKTIKESAQGVDLLEIRDTYRAFKDKLEQERASAMKEFNLFKENIVEKEKGMKASADKQVHLYKDEVEGLKAKLWHLQKLVEKVYGSEIKFDQDELKAKEAEHLQVKVELDERNKELEELKNRYQDIERAYKELEDLHAFSDKMTTNWSRDLMDNGEGLEWENELMRKKIIEQERIIFALRKAIGQENGFYDGDDAASIEYGGSSHREADLQKEWMNSQRIIKEKEIEIEKLKGRLGDDRLQLKVEEYENRLKEAGREHRKLIETLHTEYSENMAEMEAQMEKDRIRWEAIIQGMNTTLDSRNEYIAGLEEKLKSLEEVQEKMNEEAQKSSRSQQNEAALNQEIVRLNQMLADAKKQLERDLNAEREKAKNEQEHVKEEFKLEKEKSLMELKEQLSKIRSLSELQKEKILELEAEVVRLQDAPIEKLEQRAREMAEEYQNKVNELSRRHNLTLRELIEKHDEKVNQINKSYETELEEIRNELRREKELVLKMKDEDKHSEIQIVKKEYETTLQKISKSFDLQLEEKVNEYEATIKTKDFEALELRKELEKVKDILKNEMNKSDKKFQNYKELEKTVKEQNDAIESLQEELHHRQIEGEGEGSGSSYLAELKKLKEGVYINEDKDKIIREHLKYAKNMEKKFIDLKKQCEERIQMLIEKYNELVDIFEMRPSRSEDLALIRQLQEEGLGREEEVRRLSEKLKPSHSTEYLRRDESKISFSQPATNAVTSTITSDKIKKTSIKNNGPGISPSNATTILPPISVSQFSIHMRSPPASNGLVTSKKFFK